MGSSRGWGPWSRIKLDALEGYLNAFTRASATAKYTLYLDLFAGAPSNFERGTGDVILGSGHRALAASPAFDRVVLCELQPRNAQQLKDTLEIDHPGRDLVVLPGDCNIEIPKYLRTLDYSWRRSASTFAMVDQYAAEIDWKTLDFLSQWRQNPRGFKTELWLYFGDGLLPRGLGVVDDANEEYALRVDAMFGTTQWREIWQARRDDAISGHAFRAEMVNLMRWRLEHVLGYKVTIPLEFTNGSGSPIYTVIFATCNDAGQRIMANVFGKNADALQKMRQIHKARKRKAREDEAGLISLLSEDDTLTLATSERAIQEPLGPPVEPFRYRPAIR